MCPLPSRGGPSFPLGSCCRRRSRGRGPSHGEAVGRQARCPVQEPVVPAGGSGGRGRAGGWPFLLGGWRHRIGACPATCPRQLQHRRIAAAWGRPGPPLAVLPSATAAWRGGRCCSASPFLPLHAAAWLRPWDGPAGRRRHPGGHPQAVRRFPVLQARLRPGHGAVSATSHPGGQPCIVAPPAQHARCVPLLADPAGGPSAVPPLRGASGRAPSCAGPLLLSVRPAFSTFQFDAQPESARAAVRVDARSGPAESIHRPCTSPLISPLPPWPPSSLPPRQIRRHRGPPGAIVCDPALSGRAAHPLAHRLPGAPARPGNAATAPRPRRRPCAHAVPEEGRAAPGSKLRARACVPSRAPHALAACKARPLWWARRAPQPGQAGQRGAPDVCCLLLRATPRATTPRCCSTATPSSRTSPNWMPSSRRALPQQAPPVAAPLSVRGLAQLQEQGSACTPELFAFAACIRGAVSGVRGGGRGTGNAPARLPELAHGRRPARRPPTPACPALPPRCRAMVRCRGTPCTLTSTPPFGCAARPCSSHPASDDGKRRVLAGRRPPLLAPAARPAAPAVPSVQVCRSAGYHEHALYVALAAGEPQAYLDILLEDCQRCVTWQRAQGAHRPPGAGPAALRHGPAHGRVAGGLPTP